MSFALGYPLSTPIWCFSIFLRTLIIIFLKSVLFYRINSFILYALFTFRTTSRKSLLASLLCFYLHLIHSIGCTLFISLKGIILATTINNIEDTQIAIIINQSLIYVISSKIVWINKFFPII